MFLKVITTLSIAVAFFVLAAQTPDSREESDGIAIPLTKRSDTDAREFHVTSRNTKIIRGPSGMDGSERNTGTPHASVVKRESRKWSDASLDLTKFENGVWYGTIWIGTPPSSFTVQLNTGSSDLFVPASTGDENCISHFSLWDHASSQITDLNIDFTVAFADGRSASGKQYTDNVTIAGLTADVQTIGVATTYSSALEASKFAPDGVLGLGFPSLSEFRGQSPLFHTLFKEGKLSQSVFSLKLTASGGELYIGGTNTALYVQSTLVYTPVINPVLWQLMIDSIQFNEQMVLKDVPAIIDTGANFIYGDKERVLFLHEVAGGGQYTNPGGYYTFPCEHFPSITFIIGGRPFEVPARVLNKGPIEPDSSLCFSGIAVANDNHKFWAMGTLFLEQFYTVFDFNNRSPRVGFAQLLHRVY